MSIRNIPLVWLRTASIAVLDQGIVAGSNFALSFLLARWLSPEAYGAFAIGFTVLLMVASFHNALVIDPMTTLAGLVYADRLQEYKHCVIKLHLLLCAVLVLFPLLAATAVREPLIQMSLLGCAVALPCSLSFWLLRRMMYLEQSPDRTVIHSVLYGGVLLLASIASRAALVLTPFTSFLIIATASTAVTVFGYSFISRHPATPHLVSSLTLRDVASRHWAFGKWLLPAPLFGAGLSQIQTVLLAHYYGLAVTGALKAITHFTMPLTHMTIAISTVAQPALARRCNRSHGKTIRGDAHCFASSLGMINVLYVVVLCGVAAPLESLVFGGKFRSYLVLVPLLGVTSILTAVGSGYSVALRASGKTKQSMVGLIVAGIAGAATSVEFIRRWGVNGAVLSTGLAFAVSAITQGLWFTKAETATNNPRPTPRLLVEP